MIFWQGYLTFRDVSPKNWEIRGKFLGAEIFPELLYLINPFPVLTDSVN